nr:helix-turn-helix domain-containing protein [Pseudomonas otitidis]
MFGKRCLGRLDGTFKVGAETRLQRLLTRTLCERTQGFFDRPANREAEHFEGDVLELLSSIIARQTGEHRVSALSASYLLTAKRLIAEQLGDPTLSCEREAQGIGISVRHLELAHRLLSSGLDISELAYRHGYSGHAHFARSFKARHGRTPSEVRER